MAAQQQGFITDAVWEIFVPPVTFLIETGEITLPQARIGKYLWQ